MNKKIEIHSGQISIDDLIISKEVVIKSGFNLKNKESDLKDAFFGSDSFQIPDFLDASKSRTPWFFVSPENERVVDQDDSEFNVICDYLINETLSSDNGHYS